MIRPARRAGFTLLEVMVALAVVAIALGAILEQAARYASTAARLREKTVAIWIAHNRLTELEVQPAWPDVGSANNDVTMAGTSWSRHEEIAATPDPSVRRIDVQVYLSGAGSPAASVSAFMSKHGRQAETQ